MNKELQRAISHFNSRNSNFPLGHWNGDNGEIMLYDIQYSDLQKCKKEIRDNFPSVGKIKIKKTLWTKNDPYFDGQTFQIVNVKFYIK